MLAASGFDSKTVPGARMAARLGLGLVPAVVMTVALLWAMHSLIATGEYRPLPHKPLHIVDIVRVKPEPQREPIDHVEPPPVSDPPPEFRPSDNFEADVVVTSPIPAPVEPAGRIDFDHRGFSMDDGDIVTVMGVSPVYPPRALQRGIAGYCTVQFTVTRQGSVRDPVIVEDECTHAVFHRSAIEAALKTKYKPRVIDGQPVEVSGWKRRFRYELSD